MGDFAGFDVIIGHLPAVSCELLEPGRSGSEVGVDAVEDLSPTAVTRKLLPRLDLQIPWTFRSCRHGRQGMRCASPRQSVGKQSSAAPVSDTMAL
jgi:hypothetical protein